MVLATVCIRISFRGIRRLLIVPLGFSGCKDFRDRVLNFESIRTKIKRLLSCGHCAYRMPIYRAGKIDEAVLEPSVLAKCGHCQAPLQLLDEWRRQSGFLASGPSRSEERRYSAVGNRFP
jgi:hypothetical protein